QAGGRARHGGEENEFLPQLAFDVGGKPDVDLGALAGFNKCVELFVGALVRTPETHRRELAGLLDHAWRCNDGSDIGSATDRSLGSENAGNAFDTVDAILKRDQATVGTEQRACGSGRRFGVP